MAGRSTLSSERPTELDSMPSLVWKTVIGVCFGAALGGVVLLGLRPVITHNRPAPTATLRPIELPLETPAPLPTPWSQEPEEPLMLQGDETPQACWRSYWQERSAGGSGQRWLSRRSTGAFHGDGSEPLSASVVDNQGYLTVDSPQGRFYVEVKLERGGWRLERERSEAPQPSRYYLPKKPFEAVNELRPEEDPQEPYTRLDWMNKEHPAPERAPIEPEVWHSHPRAGSRPRVALTFDACWKTSPRSFDRKIFQILQQKKAPATIFLGGYWMERFPRETQELAASPLLEFGNHTYLHVHPCSVSGPVLEAELQRTEAVFYRLTSRQMAPFYRPPFGEYDDTTVATVAHCGFKTVHWSIETADPSPDQTAPVILKESLMQARAGGIVVMHINGMGHHTAEALPTLIDRLRERYELVTLSRL
ncbi:MAG: polysaccharide deacetylase family protein [Armatimonas sp.]